MNFLTQGEKGEKRKSTLVKGICIMFITIHWIHCFLLGEMKTTQSRKTYSDSELNKQYFWHKESFVRLCVLMVFIVGSYWFRILSISQTPDQNYRYLQRKRVSDLPNTDPKQEEFFPISFAIFLHPRQEKLTMLGEQSFGFCVRLIEEFRAS